MDKTKLRPLAWHYTAPLDYAAYAVADTADADTPERASRTAYIAGLIAALTFGLLLGALLV